MDSPDKFIQGKNHLYLFQLQKTIALKLEEESKLKNLQLEMKLLRANAERDGTKIKSLEEVGRKLEEQLKAANETISAKEEQHKKCGECEKFLISLDCELYNFNQQCTPQVINFPKFF